MDNNLSLFCKLTTLYAITFQEQSRVNWGNLVRDLETKLDVSCVTEIMSYILVTRPILCTSHAEAIKVFSIMSLYFKSSMVCPVEGYLDIEVSPSKGNCVEQR